MADDRPQASQDSDLSEDSDLEIGNQELVLTSPTTTQYFQNEEAQVRQYYLDETAQARAAWSSLDLYPRKYLPFIYTLEPLVDSKSSSLSEPSSFSEPSIRSSQRGVSELGSDSDFDSPSIPPSPSNLEALNKTWEQVRANNTNTSEVSAQTRKLCLLS